MAYRSSQLYYQGEEMSTFSERFGKLTVQQAIELNIAEETKYV